MPFRDVIGHRRIVALLARSVANESLPPSLVFAGPDVASMRQIATALAQRALLVTNVELIHLPQFGLLAALLLVGGLPPQLAWIVATLAGAIDETYQLLVIYRALPNVYFDWNDIVLQAQARVRENADESDPQPTRVNNRRPEKKS